MELSEKLIHELATDHDRIKCANGICIETFDELDFVIVKTVDGDYAAVRNSDWVYGPQIQESLNILKDLRINKEIVYDRQTNS